MRAVILVLLLAVAANAQVLSTEVVDLSEFDQTAGLVQSVEKPSGFGAAIVPVNTVVDHSQAIPATQEIVQTATVDLGGRKMLSSRKTLGVDGDGVQVMIDPTQNVYSRFPYKHCPTTDLPWADQSAYSDAANYTMYGDLVHDAGICLVSGNGVGKVNTTTNSTGVVYGGAVQDFGPTRPLWESYGWSLFKLQDPPANTSKADVNIQGLSLHLIGNVGKTVATPTNCSVKAVSVAIYNADQATGMPTTVNYTKIVNFTSATSTFKWDSNSSGVLYMDIAPSPNQFIILKNSTYYWLRVKVFADYGGASGNGQCFVFWGLQTAIQNDKGLKSRWQEYQGGASGYSTTCTGAQTSGAAPGVAGTIPGASQTWWNCWNNGMSTAAGNTGRRCSTYRATVNPAIPSADCLSAERARFNDYNYAFSGFQGQPGYSDEGGAPGFGSASLATLG